jgi:serine/threonine-protein kinase ATR
MRWIQQRKKRSRSEHELPPRERVLIDRARAVLERIPAKRVAERAVNCEQYPRALFNLEYDWARTPVEHTDARESLVRLMQDVYSHIDEPDGLEGLSAQLKVVDIEQQMVIHRKAGRWTVAQTWYEMRIATEPDNFDVQHDLLTCLKQSGQHGKPLLPAWLNSPS